MCTWDQRDVFMHGEIVRAMKTNCQMQASECTNGKVQQCINVIVVNMNKLISRL
jgi:hypothetical protein